jgi:hypothetical protein
MESILLRELPEQFRIGQAPPGRASPRLDWAGESDWISFDGNGPVRIRRDPGLGGTHSQAHADGRKKKLMTGTLRIWRWPRPGTRHGSAYEADAGSPLARSRGDETATAFPAGRITARWLSGEGLKWNFPGSFSPGRFWLGFLLLAVIERSFEFSPQTTSKEISSFGSFLATNRREMNRSCSGSNKAACARASPNG